MSQKNGEFLKKLLATFQVEAEEHIGEISSRLLELEKAPPSGRQMDHIEAAFREAHSLKGAARAVNLVEIETLCQSLESVFAALKQKDIALSASLFDVLHKAVDAINKLLESAQAQRSAPEKSWVGAIIQELESAVKGLLASPVPEALKKQGDPVLLALKVESFRIPAEEKPVSAETVRISSAKLDLLFLQAEELLSAKLATGQRAAESREISAALGVWEKERARIHPDLRAIRQSFERGAQGRNGDHLSVRPVKTNQPLGKLLAFLEWNDTYITSLTTRLETLARSATLDHRVLGKMIDDLLESMKKALMLPFASLLEGFPKIVRDLSRDRGKEVDLVVQGGEIEIDKRILEEIKGPLVHLVRNCIDHGIEDPQERRQSKKPPRGTITIAISPRTGDKVEILVTDDGAGINTAKVRAAAVKLGIVSQEDAGKLDGPAVLSLVYQSGVSTSPIITEISGRGLGLAIVREKVEKLGGTISVRMDPGAGTAFRTVLPLTLATFRGTLVRAGDHLFVLPTSHVERVLRVGKGDIQTVENRETISLNGRAVSLVRLADVLELPRKEPPNHSRKMEQVVLLASAEKRIAFVVDSVLDELEVLVKSLGRQLSQVRNIAGATVLGTGKVVAILNVPDLMKSAAFSGASVQAGGGGRADAAKSQSILVVEDSITARALVKNILESAGYSVTTAVDGAEAFATLKTKEFDLVVSDVDMPRMNGFDLTAKIRLDKKLSEVPVVLVTALEAREDRERGIEVGANAYIVKKSFDQSDLLGVIRRLI